jgi:antitoxin component YwqK of YwqJK toxin-antitoxin module
MLKIKGCLILTLATAISSSALAGRQVCTCAGKDINLDNGASTKDLTGTVSCKNEDTKLLAREMKYVKGIETWMRMYYYKGGIQSECGLNSRGNRDGSCKSWHENGKLREEENYVNGTTSGLAKYYDQEGTLDRITYYGDHQKTERSFNKDGSLRGLECSSEQTTKEDRELCGYGGKASAVTLYVKKGQPFRELSFLNGKLVGKKEINIETGKIEVADQFAQEGKDGVEVKKFASGQQKQEVRYDKKGRLNGIQKEYAESGQMIREALFKDGFKEQEKLFYLNGQLQRFTEKTKKDKLIFVGSTEYWDNGSKQRSGTFQEITQREGNFDWGIFWSYDDLRKEGVFKEWREDGTLSTEANYVAGKRQGISNYYFANVSKIEREETYEQGRLSRAKVYSLDGKLIEHDEFFADGSKKSHTKKVK